MEDKMTLSLNFVGGPEDGLVQYHYGDKPPTHMEFETISKRKVSYVMVSRTKMEFEEIRIEDTGIVSCSSFFEQVTSDPIFVYHFAGYQQ